MQKVVVTGGMGFIGRNVCELLINNGYDVHILDNYSTNEFNDPLTGQEVGVKIHRGTILNYRQVYDLIEGAQYVFHLAAFPRVEPSIKDPLLFNKINVEGSLNVFFAAAQHKIKKLIFSSSSSVYGDPENTPTNEEDSINPMSPYALQKYICEEYLSLFHELYRLNSISLRYFNVYGKFQPSKGAYVPVVGIFLRQLRDKQKLTVVGDGEQRRDFVNVEDVAKANYRCILADELEDGHHVYNIGSGSNYSINEIAEAISGKTKNIPERFEPRTTLANISKAEKELKWKPSINLFEWIEENKPKEEE